MKKRNPVAVLLLPLATLGVYCFYWLYKTRKELLDKLGNKDAIPPILVLLLPILLLVPLLILGFMGDSSMTQSAAEEAENAPLSAADIVSIVLIIVFMIGGLVILPLWWFWKYCKAVVQVTKGYGMDFPQLYILYVAVVWACGLLPVWMLITQLDFNKIAASETAELPGHHNKQPLV